MILKTVFLCDVSIRSSLKLQKIDKGDGTRHKTLHFRVYATFYIIFGELRHGTEKRFSLSYPSFLC